MSDQNEEPQAYPLQYMIAQQAEPMLSKMMKLQDFLEDNLPEAGSPPSPLAMSALVEMAEVKGGLEALKSLHETILAIQEGKQPMPTPPERDMTFSDDDISDDAKAEVIDFLARVNPSNKPH